MPRKGLQIFRVYEDDCEVALVQQERGLRVYLLKLRYVLTRGAWPILCLNCGLPLSIDACVVSKERSRAGTIVRCLDCAVQKHILTENVIEVD